MSATVESAYILTAEKPLACEKSIISFFGSLFEVKKLVCLKNDAKDASGRITGVVLILNFGNNIDMLKDAVVICDTRLIPRQVTIEEAEKAIKQNKTKLYVGNLTPSIDNCKLWKHFSKFGAIEYTYLIRKPTSKVKGFGFIVFEKKSSFEAALKQKHYIDGQRLICKYFLNKPSSSKCTEEEPLEDGNNQQIKKAVELILEEDIQSKDCQRSSKSTLSSKEHKPETAPTSTDNPVEVKRKRKRNTKKPHFDQESMESTVREGQSDFTSFVYPVQTGFDQYSEYPSFQRTEGSYQEQSWRWLEQGAYDRYPARPDWGYSHCSSRQSGEQQALDHQVQDHVLTVSKQSKRKTQKMIQTRQPVKPDRRDSTLLGFNTFQPYVGYSREDCFSSPEHEYLPQDYRKHVAYY